MKFALLFALVFLSIPFASAQPPADAPDEGESFSQFFARITSGGHRYIGIALMAPADFQTTFLARFRESAWVGDQNRIARALEARGVNLWGDWYRSETPLPFALPGDSAARFSNDFEIARPTDCPSCRPFPALATIPWRLWSIPERSLFTQTFVLRSPVFGGRRLVDFVAESFAFDADRALARLTVRILVHDEFVTAVRGLGWNGDVYFRGITAPDPHDATRMLVLLDGDYLRDRTEQTVPLFQMLEYVGILTHELHHVLQNLDALRAGLDLSVRSPEGLLLIEGHAETLAERALDRAGRTFALPSALSLYATQQAIGLLDKDSGDYSFFPYRTGLPFVHTLYHLRPEAGLNRSIYDVVLGKTTLGALLAPATP